MWFLSSLNDPAVQMQRQIAGVGEKARASLERVLPSMSATFRTAYDAEKHRAQFAPRSEVGSGSGGNAFGGGFGSKASGRKPAHFCAADGCQNTDLVGVMQRCKRCGVTYYCGRECQVRHWKNGPEMCKKSTGRWCWRLCGENRAAVAASAGEVDGARGGRTDNTALADYSRQFKKKTTSLPAASRVPPPSRASRPLVRRAYWFSPRVGQRWEECAQRPAPTAVRAAAAAAAAEAPVFVASGCASTGRGRKFSTKAMRTATVLLWREPSRSSWNLNDVGCE